MTTYTLMCISSTILEVFHFVDFYKSLLKLAVYSSVNSWLLYDMNILFYFSHQQGDSPGGPALVLATGDKSLTWSINANDKKQYDGIFDVR